MLHGDDDFGQVLVFDTSTNKTAKIHTPLVPFSFLFLKLKKKKNGYVLHTVTTCQYIQKRKEKEY